MNSTPDPRSLIPDPFSPAFTLVELLVVLGIIAILSAVLTVSFSSSFESARAAKCMANLKNLALYKGKSEEPAGTYQRLASKIDYGAKRMVAQYHEVPGWIGSSTKGMFPSKEKQNITPIGLYEENLDQIRYAYTNGWMYAKLNGNVSSYICPKHAAKHTYGKPNWSYFKNGGVPDPDDDEKEKLKYAIAECTLTYAEIPFVGKKEEKTCPNCWVPSGSAGTEETDAVLQVGKGSKEHIGANHKMKGKWFAHVAFADGHVEKLRVDGLNEQSLKNLTRWLAVGYSVGRHGNQFDKMDN